MFIHTYDEYCNQGYTVAAFASNAKTKHEINKWCYTVYGNPGQRWIDNIEFGEVLFKHKQDLILFLLRWS